VSLPRRSWLHRHRRGFTRYTAGYLFLGGLLPFLVIAVFILRVDVQTHYFGILPEGKVPEVATGQEAFYSYTSEQLETIHMNPDGATHRTDTFGNMLHEDKGKVQ